MFILNVFNILRNEEKEVHCPKMFFFLPFKCCKTFSFQLSRLKGCSNKVLNYIKRGFIFAKDHGPQISEKLMPHRTYAPYIHQSSS